MAWLRGGEKSKKKFENMFIRFDRMYERDGRTDRRTDTPHDSIDCA